MRVIAGPCQHESLEMSLEIAAECKRVCDALGCEYFFKASYDKANRTSMDSPRGLGLDATLRDFEKIKEKLGVKILTDVHSVEEARRVSNTNLFAKDTVDVLQIPAFLCRQTDLIEEASWSQKIVNIKKGQFLSPQDIRGVLSKTSKAKEVWITERGSTFGYNNLVVDYAGIQYMLQHYDCPIVFDATHSVQKPGGNGTTSSGNRDYAPGMARAAAAVGVDNFFFEVHPNPDDAPSDGPNMLFLKDFDSVMSGVHLATMV
jgi:2-dehydro-3-deoxyphosphooctonate aldolase (KDO 8-P synthase)